MISLLVELDLHMIIEKGVKCCKSSMESSLDLSDCEGELDTSTTPGKHMPR
jgi:hypothetical protein